jgi:hypothetical protein
MHEARVGVNRDEAWVLRAHAASIARLITKAGAHGLASSRTVDGRRHQVAEAVMTDSGDGRATRERRQSAGNLR